MHQLLEKIKNFGKKALSESAPAQHKFSLSMRNRKYSSGLDFAVRCFIVVFCAFVASAEAGRAKRPNVVMIISDDQTFTDFGFMGNTKVQTPHLDRLAAGGGRCFGTPLPAEIPASPIAKFLFEQEKKRHPDREPKKLNSHMEWGVLPDALEENFNWVPWSRKKK